MAHALKGMEETAFVRTVRSPFSLPPLPDSKSSPLRRRPPQLSKSARAVGDAALTASAPIRDTDAYKAVASEITELLENAAYDTHHGGYIDRDARRRRREARLAKIGRSKEAGMARRMKVEENPECVSRGFLIALVKTFY